MATAKIDTLRTNGSGGAVESVYPVTHTRAVTDDSGANLEDILKPATFDPTTKTGTTGLMTAEQVQKLQALVITDEGVQISGKVNADNVEGLGSWITTNRNSIEGLYPVEAKNLLDNLNKLVTDETNGLNKKVNEHDSRIAEMEKTMTWGSL